MKKRLWQILAILLLVALGYGMWQWGFLPKIYPIQTVGANVDNYPYVAWSEIANGRLARFFGLEAWRGKLPKWQGAVVPIATYITPGDGYFGEYKIRYVGLGNHLVVSETYVPADKRPYRTVAYYRTKIENDTYEVMMREWKNDDGKPVFVPLIVPEKFARNEGGTTGYYQNLLDATAPYYWAPVMQYASLGSCVGTMGNTAGYCNWLYQNNQRPGRYRQLMEKWVEEGSVPRSMGSYPVGIAKVRLQ